ncbi:MAG: MFS transporter [bacterium]|nr:MFS transporter [bacterium]
MPQHGQQIGQTPDWLPHERPMLPGSPSTPDFPTRFRIVHGLISLLIGVTGSLGAALVQVNLPAIQGSLGLTPNQGAWLITIYVMTNISMNLLLVKYRQQFGIRRFALVFLSLYTVAAFAHLALDNFAMALILRAISGVGAAALTALAMFYMLQAFPASFRIGALVLGVGVSQLGAPLARVISTGLLDAAYWQGLYALEACLAAASLAAVLLFRLPQGVRIQVFERIDALTFALLGGGLGLVVATLGLGRIVWWFEAPWLGWCLVVAVIMLVAGSLVEHGRAHPLIDTRWVATAAFLRFCLNIALVRVILSEQTVGAAGLMQALGLAQEQQRLLYGLVLAATAAGIVLSAMTLNQKTLATQFLMSILLIAVAAFMDSGSTLQTGPGQLFLSQALLAFAAAMFLGPSFMFGIGQLLTRGLGSIITFSVMFGVAQNLGGLFGAAMLGTFQTVRAQQHAVGLAERLTGADPTVAATLQGYAGVYASTQADPALRAADASLLLTQQVTQQANILAFNDVFLVIGLIALVQFFYAGFLFARLALRMKAAASAAPQPPRPPPPARETA